MKRFATALVFAMMAAMSIANAQGKPGWVPPSDPPGTLLESACSLLPSAAAAWVPFCD